MIDTNVLAVAEGLHDEASEDCQLACIAVIEHIAQGCRVTLDSSREILTEYLRVLESSPQSGPGRKLAKHLASRWRDDRVCHLVEITPDGAGSYAEVPTSLRDFDADDQKFLAASAATGEAAPIYQALDREWWSRRTDLGAEGFTVLFICSTALL